MISKQQLLRIAEAAHNLEDWLGQNTGENSSWLIEIKCDVAGAQAVTSLLTDLFRSLKPYRTHKSGLEHEASLTE